MLKGKHFGRHIFLNILKYRIPMLSFQFFITGSATSQQHENNKLECYIGHSIFPSKNRNSRFFSPSEKMLSMQCGLMTFFSCLLDYCCHLEHPRSLRRDRASGISIPFVLAEDARRGCCNYGDPLPCKSSQNVRTYFLLDFSEETIYNYCGFTCVSTS